jgi:glycosyltransferase involved in cell wall biosynthesis
VSSPGQPPLSVSIVSCPFDAADRDPEALLVRFHALVCWAEALVETGAGVVTVVQRYHRDTWLRRKGVDYQFVADGGPPTVPPWYWGATVVRAVTSCRPTVVHVDGVIFPLLVRHLRLRLAANTAIVVQDHGGIHQGSPGFRDWRWRMFHRIGLRAADGFLFTARELATPWQRARIIGGSQRIYEVLESSTDLGSLVQPTAGSPHGSEDAPDGETRPRAGSPALLWVGRLDGNKDPLTVLAAFEEVVAAFPAAVLTMVYGADDLLPQVKRRIDGSPRIAGRVQLRGRLDHAELPALYAAADFFVLGSHHEGSGFALIEALSFGVIPVVTDIPSFRMITDEGRLGALFPPGDARAMAAALVRLAREDLVSRRERVRAYFVRECSWSAVGRKTMEVYRTAAMLRRAAFQAGGPSAS